MIWQAAIVAVPLTVILFRWFRSLTRRGKMKAVTGGLLGINGVLTVAALMILLIGVPLGAQETGSGEATVQDGTGQTSTVALGAALATGLSSLGAGIAVSVTGSAAIGGMTQRPEIFGRSLVFVGLAEGIAIYGLIVSFLILT